jgi:hypothetical protein
MADFETKQYMQRDHFLTTADTMLAEAQMPETSLQEAASKVGSVANVLAQIENKTLEIQPPLSDRQFAQYAAQTAQVHGLLQKGFDALEVASQTETVKPGAEAKS